jgi:riboflavin kinase/FMN adenylyltransferase
VQVISDPQHLTPERPTVVTIGKFDGVHRGHRHLLRTVVACAREHGWQAAVIILWPPPPEVLRPGTHVPRLGTLAERTEAIAAEGIDLLVLWPFTRELSRLSPREFIDLLCAHLDMRLLVVGSDFALGRERTGTPDVLKAIGAERGFEVSVIPPLLEEGQVVSSTAIRTFLQAGDIGGAARLLGRWPTLTGLVVAGEKRGRALGFPTANLELQEPLLVPADGIYATFATVDPDTAPVTYPSVTSIGVRPTFHTSGHRTVETYLCDYSGGELYSHPLRLHFVARLRDEQRFATVEALIEQMQQDVAQARQVLAKHPPPGRPTVPARQPKGVEG